jgi:hypothetical protein
MSAEIERAERLPPLTPPTSSGSVQFRGEHVKTHRKEGEGNSWEVTEDLLKALGRVVRVEVALG